MRGEVWAFHRPRQPEPLPALVVQSEILNRVAPTVVGLVVTAHEQRAGPPVALAVPAGTCELVGPAWIKVTQVHTLATADAREHLATLGPDALDRVDDALRQVLGLGRVR